MTISIDPRRLQRPEGIPYLAIRSRQGNRTVYTLRIKLADIRDILPIPNPSRPQPGNRLISERHARGFGSYIRRNGNWVAPSLLVRDPGVCRFDPISDGADDSGVGYLTIPFAKQEFPAWQRPSSDDAADPVALSSDQLNIIDGQHRVFGACFELAKLEDELATCRKRLHASKDGTKKHAELTGRIRELDADIHRIGNEYIGVDIYDEPSQVGGGQMFADVASNAKGITAATLADLDMSKIINRTLRDVHEHPLLNGLVDFTKDRMTDGSDKLIGAKHVTDITRGLLVGVVGRVTEKREAELEDDDVAERMHRFLDLLVDSFTDLKAVRDRTMTPQELRERSLLSSVGMLRILAGTYYRLAEDGIDHDSIGEFFRQLNGDMGAPVADDSIWRSTERMRESFEYGASAPVMRSQNLGYIVEDLVGWYHKNTATQEAS